MPTLAEHFTQQRIELNTKIALGQQYTEELAHFRTQDNPDPAQIQDLREKKAVLEASLPSLREKFAQLEEIVADDARETIIAEQRFPTDAGRRMRGGSSMSTPETSRTDQWVNKDTGERAALRAGESFGSHPIVARARTSNDAAAEAQHGNLATMIRAMATTGGGSAIVPSSWAGDLIDRVRNASSVISAGATIIPMDTKVMQIGRLTGDPTAAFRTEGSLITATDAVLDNVTLTATTQSALVVGSMEWFQDADNADTIITDALSAAIALQLDLTALYGGITTGAGTINLPTPPNPRGILAALNATLPANVLGNAANGTTQTAVRYWDEVIDTIFRVRDGNEEPNAMIWNSKLARQYAKAYDTQGQPLRLPVDVEQLRKFTSNQIPSRTQGTMTTATDLFVGDFTQLLIGQRLGLTIQVLTERYAEFGQIGMVAHWRGDIAPARSTAFAVFRALNGAA